MKTEFRFAEFRAEGGVLRGTALRYGDTARIGPFTERFDPGSVEISPDAIANIQHDRLKPVARIGAGLRFEDGPAELRAVIELPDTTIAKEARELVDAGILRGFSLEFRAKDEAWNGKERTIRSAIVMGLGIVDVPAYRESEIAKRMEWFRDQVTPPFEPRLYWY